MPPPEQPRALTKSLIRAMEILKSVAEAPDGADPASIAAGIGVPRPTVYRLLSTLESVGMVERDADGRWFLGFEVVRLGHRADIWRALASRAQDTLEELVNATGETAMLAVVRGFNAEVITQVDAPNLLAMASWVGRPIPMQVSVAGRLVLADLTSDELASYLKAHPLERFTAATITDPALFERALETVARRGYAETVDELEDGLSGIGSAVRRDGGPVIASVGIYGPTARFSGSRHDEFVAAVLEAGARLSASL